MPASSSASRLSRGLPDKAGTVALTRCPQLTAFLFLVGDEESRATAEDDSVNLRAGLSVGMRTGPHEGLRDERFQGGDAAADDTSELKEDDRLEELPGELV